MEKKEIAFNKFYKLFNLISIFLVNNQEMSDKPRNE